MQDHKTELLNETSASQFFRYSLVGAVINIAGYLIYLVLTSLGSTPKVTITLLYVFVAAIGFTGNRNLTFSDQGNPFSSGIRYIVAHSFGYSINYLILFILVDRFGYAHQFVQAIAIIIVAGLLFIAFKLFVFRNACPSSLESK